MERDNTMKLTEGGIYKLAPGTGLLTGDGTYDPYYTLEYFKIQNYGEYVIPREQEKENHEMGWCKYKEDPELNLVAPGQTLNLRSNRNPQAKSSLNYSFKRDNFMYLGTALVRGEIEKLLANYHFELQKNKTVGLENYSFYKRNISWKTRYACFPCFYGSKTQTLYAFIGFSYVKSHHKGMAISTEYAPMALSTKDTMERNVMKYELLIKQQH